MGEEIMKKRMKYLFLFGLLLLGASCINDSGNYDYISKNDILPVTISGLPEKYSIGRSELLHFAPEVEIGKESAGYTYSWFITEATAAGMYPSRRHLADTKDLNYEVLLDAGSWLLSFEVADRKRDIYKRHEIKLSITASPINVGWYVLKDINDKTDFDYINKEGQMYADALKLTDNEQLDGEAVSMIYQPGYYYQLFPNADGTSTLLGGQKVFYILSTKDIRVIDANNMVLFKTFDDMFYTIPEKREPQNISYNSPVIFLMNAGQIHSLYTGSKNYGIFGAFTLGDYDFFNRVVLAKGSDLLAFDKKSNSFCTVLVGGAYTDPIADKLPESTVKGPTSVTNMPYSLVKMESGESTSAGVSAFALMQHVSTGEYYLAQLLYTGSKAYPIVDFTLVPSGCLLPSADLIAAPTTGSFVYFAKDNKVYSYVGASGETEKERLMLEFAPNEKVTYIKHFYYLTAPANYNYLAVLTNVNSKWKLRIYTPEGVGELEPGIVAEYEGEGNGRYVMYRN